MAKKKKDKDINYSELDMDDLNRRLQSAKESLFKMKFRAAAAPPKNVMDIRNTRREVARLLTFINQKRSQTV